MLHGLRTACVIDQAEKKKEMKPTFMKSTLAAACCAALALGAAFVPAEPAHAISFGSSETKAELPDFVKLVEENGPGVVNISVIKNARTVDVPGFGIPGFDERHAEIFRRFGLSGKSFIPMLIGSGCGVPGIMASRTIEQDRDRKMTIMTTTFIPCGAKMPIVALIAGALFGGAWWVAPSAYFIGVAAIIISGIILKKTKLFAGDPAPFVMELPQYHLPTVKNVLRGTWERGSSFIKKAGTVILLSSIFVWFTSSFGFVDGTFGMVDDIDASVLASIGSVVAPVFAPLGFGNWQTAVATVLGLVAKEEVVGALGTIYAVAGDALELVEEGAFGELGAIAQHFTALSAYSFLVFNLLCAPCFAAIGAIKREMNNAKWTWFAIGYQTVFAYTMSFMLYQFGLLFTGAAGFSIGTAIAAVILVVYLWLLFRKGYVEKPTRLRSVDTVKA